MKVCRNEQVICCDIDETLVLWDPQMPGKKVSILCPYNLHGKFNLKTHEPHLRLIKERLVRGAVLIVWSAGGYQWAEAVLNALGIDSKNIYVFSKPIAYVDDKSCEKWMGEQVYLPPGSHWKPNSEQS